MAGEKCAFENIFSFKTLPTKKFSFLQDKEVTEFLMKWSMLGRISAHSYSFDHNFSSYSSDRFVQCFFRDPIVASSLRRVEAGVWVPVGMLLSVSVAVVPCTKVSMDLFDPLYSCGILRPSGHILKCFHDVYPDYDELRQVLDEDSEHYGVLGREQRGEFLFLLFKHLCLGGELCQYEDTIDPYISVTKKIYKDLISVQKDPETKKISVVSTVLKVCARDESGRRFPGTQEEEQTFAYLIVDPFKRHATLFCHFYGVGNFTV
uniref:Cilia- and flagella-associated protein 300 n=1 Tax=Salarias fasciatus TaxID=181472 RepID=A0A672FJ35_SALFA